MEPWLITALVVLALVVGAAGLWIYTRRRTSARLRARFGPEYERAIRETGDRDHAEKELAAREERTREFALRPLSSEDRTRFEEEWRGLQGRFVDDPVASTGQADLLVTDLMTVRGYPMTEFEQRAADLSVDHPVVVQNYRAARELALLARDGRATTEQLRQALVHYRALFDELLHDRGPRLEVAS